MPGEFHPDYGTVWNETFAALVREDEREKQQEPVAYEVGGWYKQQDGEWVRFVGVANPGTSYETMFCSDGIHRYTRRDYGRATGTAHDYSCPLNTPPLYASPATASQAARQMRDAAVKVCDELYKHDRKESGYDEGWNDGLDIAEQIIAALPIPGEEK